MEYLYNQGIRIFGFAIKVLAAFYGKARKWVRGRHRIFEKLSEGLHERNNQKLIWFHCASLGEFEQGRPLIEQYKKHKQVFVLITFFSPSGYEIRKNYEGADYVTYLPLDTPAYAAKFVDMVNPDAVFFVKYEFWYNFLKQLHLRKVPVYLVSGIFRSDQVFFKPWGGFFRKILKYFDKLFVQDSDSYNLVKPLNAETYMAGDTRFDRVWTVASNTGDIPVLANFTKGYMTLIIGSSWPADLSVLHAFLLHLPDQVKVVLAPHETEPAYINPILNNYKHLQPQLFTQITDERVPDDSRLLIIDQVGFLSYLYRYGDIAYVGGAFGKGLHNILEPAVFGLPLIFGPRYQKFNEARTLVAQGGAYSIQDEATFMQVFTQLMNDPDFRHKTGRICRYYIEQNRGAVQFIIDHCQFA